MKEKKSTILSIIFFIFYRNGLILLEIINILVKITYFVVPDHGYQVV